MKKTISILLAGMMMISPCAGVFADAAETESVLSAAEEVMTEEYQAASGPDYTTGTPWPDTDLEGVVTEDMSADARDNYALFVNKDAILNYEIPEGYPYGGTLMDVALKNAGDIKAMFLGEEPESHDAKLAYDLFWLMMDWDTRNELGVAPLKERVDAVEAISTPEELTAYSILPSTEKIYTLFSAGASADLLDSSKKILSVASSDLLLEDSAEYSELTDYGAIKKAAVTEYLHKVLVKLGYTDEEADQKIENCLAFEEMIAPAIHTNQERRQPDYIGKVNNHYTRKELEEAQGSIPVLPLLEDTYGFPEQDDYLVLQPEYLKKLNEVWSEENLPLIKDYLIAHGIKTEAWRTDRECYELDAECDNAMTGATGMRDDETVFSGSVSNVLNWPVARLYTETYLKQEDKDRISAMVDEILEAYHGILEEADFFSEETRAKAVEKLEAIRPNILYPDDWEKYSCEGLDFASAKEGGTYWDAFMAISEYFIEKEVREFSDPVDKGMWVYPPQVVNCTYMAQTNSICILGAFAQGDIYNSEMSDEDLYARLGTVIGHEISHAFDSTGAQFDKDGNIASWWTPEDYAVFMEKNEKMAAYYNAMHPWEGQDFYGSIMTGEACADMAGLKCILRIAAEKEDFDYDAFFRSYAALWLTKDTLQMAYARINDNHPMGYLRINATLQQYDEFLDFYGIEEGDGMYLAPEDRVTIW